MGTRTEAIDGLMQIAGQGEAPDLRHPRTRTSSDFDRFMAVYDGVAPVAAQVSALVKNLPTNPTTRQQPADDTVADDSDSAALQRQYISNPASRTLAQLSDQRYLMLVTNLAHSHLVASSPTLRFVPTGAT